MEEALAALHPQAPAAFSFRSAELLAFSYHLPALERLQALPLEARGELLALMAGSFLTREKASWENMQVGLKLGEALLQWEDGEGALGFLRALGKLEAPLLTYGDWLKAFELGLPPHILPDFLKILFGTETVLDWFTDRRGAYSLARQVLFGLGSAEDSRKPPF